LAAAAVVALSWIVMQRKFKLLGSANVSSVLKHSRQNSLINASLDMPLKSFEFIYLIVKKLRSDGAKLITLLILLNRLFSLNRFS